MRYDSLFCAREPGLLRALFIFSASIFLLGSSFLFGASVVYARAPVYDGTVSPEKLQQAISADKDLAARLDRLERGNAAMLEMLKRLDTLQQDVRNISGSAEEQAHRVDTMKKRQHELYLDIDRRLSKLEQMLSNNKMGSAAPPLPTGKPMGQANAAPGAKPAASATSFSDTQLEMDAYNRAFDYLKRQKYALAIPSFQAFLQSFPNAKLADKAQYWLGEANYIQRKYADAIDEFTKFINSYPSSSKLPDARLKLGMSQKALGDTKLAIETLETVVQQHPKSTAARMAKKRLQLWKGG